MKYSEIEREKAIKLREEIFHDAGGGKFNGNKYDFVLQNPMLNLWEGIREDAIAYFANNDIEWHKDTKGEPEKGPEGHLLSSNIACINHLFQTSVDALIYAVHKNSKKYIIPIEWKYTEKYGNEDKSNGLSGETRLKRYSKLIDNSSYLKSFSTYKNSVYFFEPFYQLMRQTLWAEQMINHNNTETIKADDYIHLHIIPKQNKELLDKKYKISNKGLYDTWIDNLHDKNKYRIIDPSDLMKNINKDKYSDLLEYLSKRYWKI
jgi:hypothetical protein